MTGITIKNPSNGNQAFVSSDNQLFVQSENLSLQHYISRYRGQMYQAQFTDSGITNTTNVIGHIKNDSSTLSLVLAYVRLQAVDLSGGTAVPSLSTYFTLNFDETYSSGGSAVTPVNMNRSSGNSADVIAYDSDPTLAGTAVEFERLYVTDEGQPSYRKEGSIILGPNDTMSIKLVTDHTSGTGYCRLSFMMMDFTK